MPLVLHQSRLKLAITAVLFAALTAMLAFIGFLSAYLPALWAYLGIALFAPVGAATALAAMAATLGAIQPATLAANANGLSFTSWRHTRQFAWTDIEDIMVLSPEKRLRSPGCALKAGARKFVSFGRNWEKSPEDVVAALQAAQALSATAPAKSPAA